jgi:hypothetical protein
MHGQDDNGIIREENEDLEDDKLWSVEDLLKSIRYLTDNFVAFKRGGASGIKVPTLKQRKGFYESFKECTFKPTINKRS